MPDTNLHIHVPEHVEGGVWANHVQVRETEYECTIDFIRMDYRGTVNGPTKGILFARVNLPHMLAEQLRGHIDRTLAGYARRSIERGTHGTT